MIAVRTRAAALAAAALLLAGCAPAPRATDVPDATAVSDARPGAAGGPCKDGKPITASIAPDGISSDPGSWPANSTMADIVKRGRLIVGTSGDAQLWGAADPQDRGKVTGYDVDLAAAVAQALGVEPQYKVLALSDRQAALNRPVDEGGVDLVAERMTINCDRWQGTSAASPAVNFSFPYYLAGQERLLVRAGRNGSSANGIEDFKDQPVCGVTGSSSLAGIQGKGAKIVEAPSAGQCLVMFQEGEAVAVTGDDTTLAGLQYQDPKFSKVVGPQTANVPYGLGLPPGDAAFTSFVNSVLEGLRSGSGASSLPSLYNRWMKPQVGGSPPATDPEYGRNLAALAQQKTP